MPFNLKDQLIAYGAYHRHPTNILIHQTCVPLLLSTSILLGTNTPSLRLPQRLAKPLSNLNLPLNLGTLTALSYSTLYVTLSPNIAGLTLAPIILFTASLCNRLTRSTNNIKRVNVIAAVLHVFGWAAQFVGHGRFEGRRPALVDNLVQALGLAPLFVWYETLFSMGFYGGLRGVVERGVEERVGEMDGEGGMGKGGL